MNRLDTADARSLEGYSVLVTRPEDQARDLLAGIRDRGGQAVFAPMIVITPRLEDPAPQALIARLADFNEVYSRSAPAAPLGEVLRAHRVDTPDVGLVTSLESLSNLAAQIDAEKLDRLYDLPLLVVGERTAREVARLGFTRPPGVLDNPGDGSLLAALEGWVRDER